MPTVGVALSEPGTGGHAHDRDPVDRREFAISDPSEAVHRHAHDRHDAERSQAISAHAERDQVLHVSVAVASVGVPEGGGDRRGEGEVGNRARGVIRDQFDIFPGMGHHNGLGDDAKSSDHGAGIVCRWWHRRGSHLLRRVEDAGLVCASCPSTAPSLWSGYVSCHSLHRYRLALLLGFEILREEFVPQYRCLHLMHAISRGCTVSRAFSFSCQTFRSLFFVLDAGQPTQFTMLQKMKSFVVELATCGMGKY